MLSQERYACLKGSRQPVPYRRCSKFLSRWPSPCAQLFQAFRLKLAPSDTFPRFHEHEVMQRHLGFRRISPGNRMRFSAHLYQWRKSIGQTTAHSSSSIYVIYIHPILDSMHHLWILNDTGRLPVCWVRKIGPKFCSGIWNRHRGVPGRNHGTFLKLYRFLTHWSISGTIINQMRNRVTNCNLSELHLANHLLKVGAARRLEVCTFLSKK